MAAPLEATYDPTTPAGYVRLTIADTDTDDPIFADTEIAAFLAMGNQNWRLGAAYALEAIASDTTQVLRVIKTLDLETNGPATARDLRAHAASLRNEVEEDGTDWVVAEFADPGPQYNERIIKQAMREQF